MNPRIRLLCLVSAVFFLGITALGQTEAPPKSALERRGLYHATIEGRFVSNDGTPVSGAHVQLSGVSPRSLPLVDLATGADGRFLIRDVNTSYMPDLRWYPPEQWQTGAAAIAGESGSNTNVGTIQLQPNTVVRVTVEPVGGPVDLRTDRPPTIILKGKSNREPRIFADDAGSYQVLRQIPFDEGTMLIELYTKGGSETYEAPFRTERGRRDQLLRVKLLRNTLKRKDRYTANGTLEVQEATLPPSTIEREFHARGRVLAPDGSPIFGAIVTFNLILFDHTRPQWTVSAEDGEFDFKYTALSCIEPEVSYGESDRVRFESTNSKEECEARWNHPQDLVIAHATRLNFQIAGVDPAAVRAYWWHDSFGWTEFSSLRPWIPYSYYPQPVYKVDSPGLISRAKTMGFPVLEWEKKPPSQVQVGFRYDSSSYRLLTVRANGRSLPNAIVDVEIVEDLTKNSRIRVGTYTTSAEGELRLTAGVEQLVEVFVYANGYEPRRAIWTSGVSLTLDLIPRNSAITFGMSSKAVRARIRPIANPGAVITANLATGMETPLAAGEYEITMYDDQGAVMGCQRITLKPAEKRNIDPAVDERPRLTLRFPSSGWVSEVNESTPSGGAVNWVAMTTTSGTLQLNDIAATKIQSSPQEHIYILSRGGNMQVQVRREDSPILWRDIRVRLGESVIIDVPAERATLEAPSNFDPGNNEHGIAGPRMQLIADSPSDWSVTEYLPEMKGGAFTTRGIPPGNYHLYHHLLNGAAAWGGIAVHLAAGKKSRMAALYSKLGELRVILTDPSGQPINNATLRIRDRMSDAWRQIGEDPTRISGPGKPIPYPAAVRIVDGKARLPQIRSGWLEFVVETDAGPAFSYTMPISLGQELQVTVPSSVLTTGQN